MKFPYLRYEVNPTPAQPEAEVIFRPVIRVRLSGERLSADYYALLDTGADESYITQEMAIDLGVELLTDSEHTEQTASGQVSVSYGSVEVELSDGTEEFAWKVTMGIVPEPWPEAILGHVGFLEFFDASFCYADCSVELIRNSVPLPSDTVR